MLTDSAIDTRAPGQGLALVLTLVLALSGCAQRPPPPGGDLLIPLARPAPWLPQTTDLLGAKAAASALATDIPTLEKTVKRLDKTSDSHKGEDLDALAQNLLHSTLDDPEAYRKASQKLGAGWGTDPALDARLQQSVNDDLLRLAWRRRMDTWEIYWARTFNAISRPLGQAAFNGFIFAPLQLSTSVAHYLASFSNDEALAGTDRQALTLRKEWLARNPEDEDYQYVLAQVEGGDKKLGRTMQARRLRTARRAEKAERYRVAAMEAQRALFWGPSAEATQILDDAKKRLEDHWQLFEASLEAEPLPPGRSYGPESRALAIALLSGSGESTPLTPESIETLEARAQGKGDTAGEAAYIFALAQYEGGAESASWRTLAELAKESPEHNNMARYAAHLVDDPWQNPYRAYKEMRRSKFYEEVTWRLFGNYATRSRYPNLPRPIALLLESPGIASTVLTSPLRLIFGRWQKSPDFQQPSAILGYRYLALEPRGENAEEVMAWLFSYEQNRENFVGALRIADFLPRISNKKRAELAEAASAQQLAAAAGIRRPDRRIQVLRHTSVEYPDSASGKMAGYRVRAELEDASPQKITITRDFLKETPRVAGPGGFGINPILINGKIEDGELHPIGITLLGGLNVRFDLVGEDGDEDSLPLPMYKEISSKRMAQLAAMLDETTRRNELIDPDDRLAADADRDQFLERALLGLADRPDKRPTAQSTYVYESMRERYGMVRGRESILPFDLVFQGSFTDLNLGAFPRWRPPKKTPDAFLYR
ncbi:MAG: hypothetical protein OSB70_12870 [Myxococcota bacterium]|nr:hypothetical protein [Myxococcota bacterium]